MSLLDAQAAQGEEKDSGFSKLKAAADKMVAAAAARQARFTHDDHTDCDRIDFGSTFLPK